MCLRPTASAMRDAVAVFPTPGVPVTRMFGRLRSVSSSLSLIFGGIQGMLSGGHDDSI